MADATTANAAPAGAPAAPAPRISLFSILIQGFALFFIYTRYRSSKTGAAVTAPQIGVEPSPLAVELAPGAAPTPAATGPLAEFSNLLNTIQEASSGRRKVDPELRAADDERLARLVAAQRAGGPIQAAWPPGVRIDVLVLLSTSADADAAAGTAERGRRAGAGAGAGAGNETVLFDGLLNVGSGNSGDGSDAGALLWHTESVALGDSAAHEARFNVSLPAAVLANASRVFAHVFFTRGGAPIDPAAAHFSRRDVVHVTVPMIRYLKRKPKKPRFNLMGEDSGAGATPTPPARVGIAMSTADRAALDAERADAKAAAAAEKASEKAVTAAVLPYWKPTLHVQLVNDFSPLPPGALPPMITPVAQVFRDDATGAYVYTPHFYLNDFWLLGHHLVPLNETADPVVPLVVSYSPVAMWRWAIEAQMTTSWEVQNSIGASSESETDMIKSILTDTNPVLLGVTMIVSLLHSVFDFLAFKNSISFWRSQKSLAGLSMRTVAMSVFFQTVIFLYLVDFGDTSYMILVSNGIGLCIEVWKLMRAMGGRFQWDGWRPRVDWGSAEHSLALSKTQEYDAIATSHLLFVMAPLIVGYAAFSLYHEMHRGVYSWLLSSTVSFIYMFGFAQMVPQLYINYRLKSVAHMPWKAMGYKFVRFHRYDNTAAPRTRF
jgi:hypothetical protein